MTAIYRAHSTRAADGNCGICCDPLNSKKAVAHTGTEGYKHPIHLDCIKLWASSERIECLFCSIPTDINSLNDDKALYTLKERIVRELKYIGIDALIGVQTGGLVVNACLTFGEEKVCRVAIFALLGITIGFGGYVAEIVNSSDIALVVGSASVGGVISVAAKTLIGFRDLGVSTAISVAIAGGLGLGVTPGLRFKERMSGILGTTYGAIGSSILIGLAGIGADALPDAVLDENLTSLNFESEFAGQLLFPIGVVASAAILGGFLGRRFSRL